jgi:ABC-2 type transport system ATP-binding protein
MSSAPGPGDDVALSVRGLSFAYCETQALSDIRLDLGRGTFTALLGHNGAGKTTLFSLLLRLLSPPPGTVLINGKDMTRQSSQALASLGMVFQEPTLDLDLTVRQNLSYFGALRGMPGALVRERITEGLAWIEMADAADRRVRTLSIGQRRRIEVVRAMLHQPELLLLDEATTGLDVPSRAAIIKRVHDLSETRGTTVLWATHIIDEVRMTDRVIVLHKGRIVAEGSVPELLVRTTAADLASAYATLTGAGKASVML